MPVIKLPSFDTKALQEKWSSPNQWREEFIKEWSSPEVEKFRRPYKYALWYATSKLPEEVIGSLFSLKFADAVKSIGKWVTAGKPDYLFYYDDLLKNPANANDPILRKLPHMSTQELKKFKDDLVSSVTLQIIERLQKEGMTSEQVTSRLKEFDKYMENELNKIYISSQFHKKTPIELSTVDKELLSLVSAAKLGYLVFKGAQKIIPPAGKKLLPKILYKGTAEGAGWAGFSLGYDMPKLLDKESEMTVHNMLANTAFSFLLGKYLPPVLASGLKATTRATGQVVSTAVYPAKWAGQKAIEKIKKNPELLEKIEEHTPSILWGLYGRIFNPKSVIPKSATNKILSNIHGVNNYVSAGISEKTYAGFKNKAVAEELNSLFENVVLSNEKRRPIYIKLGWLDEKGVVNLGRYTPEQKFSYLWFEGIFNPENPAFKILKERYPNLYNHVENEAINSIRLFDTDKTYLNLLEKLKIVTPKSIEKAKKGLAKYERFLNNTIKEKEALENKFNSYIKAYSHVQNRLKKELLPSISRFNSHIRNIGKIADEIAPEMKGEILANELRKEMKIPELYGSYKAHLENIDALIERAKQIKKEHINKLLKEKDELINTSGKYIEELNVAERFERVYNQMPELLRKGQYQELLNIVTPFAETKTSIGKYANAVTKFVLRNRLFKDVIRKDKTLDNRIIRLAGKIQNKKEALFKKEQKLLENLDTSIFERFSLARDPIGALLRRDATTVINNIFRMSPKELQVHFKRTLTQPSELETMISFVKSIEDKNIPKHEIKRAIAKVIGTDMSIPDSAIRRITKEIEFKHSLPFKAKEEQISEIIKAMEIDEKTLFEILEQMPSVRNLVSRIKDILITSGANDITASSIAKRLISELYGLVEKIPASQRFLTTPVSNYLMSKQARFMFDVATGRDLLRTTKFAKFSDWFTVPPKALMLSISPFHTLSLAKSFTYSTGDMATAIKSVYDTNKAMLKFYKSLLKFKSHPAEKAAEDFISKQRQESFEMLKQIYPKLKEIGIDAKDLPVTFGRTLDVAWLSAETDRMKTIARLSFGDISPTAIIFEGMYPYLKARDISYVVDKALIDIKTNPSGRQRIINEMIRNITDVNWKYGGLIEFLRQSADTRRVWRTILLAPDWQLSLMKQFLTPIIAPNEARLRYLASTFAYNYLMYSLEQSNMRGYHDPVNDFDRFLTRLFDKKNPFEALNWDKFLYKMDFFAYEKEPIDWILAFKDIVANQDFHEALRIYFNRSSMPIRFIQYLAGANDPTHWSWKGLAVQFPFLAALPIPIQNLLTHQELYNINAKGSFIMTTLQALSVRAQIVPASNILSEMIRHKIFYPSAFETYISLPEGRKQLIQEFEQSYGTYGKRGATRYLSPRQFRNAVINSNVQKLLYKDYRLEYNDAVSLAKSGQGKLSREKTDEIVEKMFRSIEQFKNVVPEEYKNKVSFYLPSKAEIGKVIEKLIKSELISEQKRKYQDDAWLEVEDDEILQQLPPSLYTSPYNDGDYLFERME